MVVFEQPLQVHVRVKFKCAPRARCALEGLAAFDRTGVGKMRAGTCWAHWIHLARCSRVACALAVVASGGRWSAQFGAVTSSALPNFGAHG